MTATLFDPIQLGDYQLRNRVFMAPMTRGRTGAEGIPGPLVAEYYAQRASAGLIIAEATAVNRRGDGWPGAPGIYTDAQQAGWAQVAKAVHGAGGRIFLQLWHMGRAVLPDFIDGQAPLAPSPVAAEGAIPNAKGEPTPFSTPIEMSRADIDDAIAAFASAARRAVWAGLDGVEIHAANNFLIDSFLRDGTNQRTDGYGGSIANRTRFLLEVVDAVTQAIGAGRVGVRISPTNAVFGIADSDPSALFVHVAGALSTRNLAYLHVLEPATGTSSPMSSGLPNVAPALREAYRGVLILNGALGLETGSQRLADGVADAAAYGVPFIANPDLVRRFRDGVTLAEPDAATYYTPGAEGYTTYPAVDPVAA